MQILITGAAGFIGSHIATELVKRGHYVIAIDDLSGAPFGFSNIEKLEETSGHLMTTALDCSDFDAIKNICETFTVDTLVHLAANAREGASQFQPYIVTKRNSLAYAATLSACLTIGVKNVVLFSSMSVYGDHEPPFSEDMKLNPVDIYATNKAQMEQATAILSKVHDFDYVIVRPHNVFGTGQSLSDKMRNVVAIFMNRIMEDEPLFIYGDGQQLRSFSYIADSLPCFVQCVENCGRSPLAGETINIGGINHISINTLAKEVMRAMDVSLDYPVDYLPDRPCEVKNAFATYAKSERLLGYKETIGWIDGVHKMAAWAKEQGPQKWLNSDPLEIISSKVPAPWLEEVEV